MKIGKRPTPGNVTELKLSHHDDKIDGILVLSI